MQTPQDNKAGAKDKVTPGGKAFERIRQDRAARGLDELPAPSSATVTKDPFIKKGKPKRA